VFEPTSLLWIHAATLQTLCEWIVKWTGNRCEECFPRSFRLVTKSWWQAVVTRMIKDTQRFSPIIRKLCTAPQACLQRGNCLAAKDSIELNLTEGVLYSLTIVRRSLVA